MNEVDEVTKSWIRNESDNLAVANGCRFDLDRAQHAVDWIESTCVLYEGECAGQPMILGDWQGDAVMRMFGWVKWSKKWKRWVRRFRQASIWIPKKNGKALALDTPVPTPQGWTTVGELRPGDVVFDVDGKQTAIIAKTEVFHGRQCYEVEFSNGETIVCDAGHLWVTRSLLDEETAVVDGRQKRVRPLRVRETSEIAATVHRRDGARAHSMPMPSPIRCARSPLPFDPYVLGVWLGNGDSDAARITCHEDDAPAMALQFAACGEAFRQFSTKAESRGVRGGFGNRDFRTRLRKRGLFRNKHIPAEFLRASLDDRIALLQGMMDSDGCVNKSGRNLIYSTSREAIKEGFCELLSSLGVKFSATYLPHLSSWRIQFFCFRDVLPAFRLERKLNRMLSSEANVLAARSRTLQIVRATPIESVPVQCVTVASPTSQLLIGRTMIPTHNSPTLAAIGLYLLIGDGEEGQKVYLAAKDGNQARTIAGKHSVEMVHRSPSLSDPSVCKVNLQTFQITYLPTSSIMVPLSSGNERHQDAKEGLNGSVLVDETHVFPRTFADIISRAGISRSEPLHIEVSTAGNDQEGYGKQRFDLAMQVIAGTQELESLLAIVYAAPQDVSDEQIAEDPEKYGRMANPAWDRLIDPEEFRADYEQSKHSITAMLKFKMYRLNVWQAAANPWLKPGDWAGCYDRYEESDLAGQVCFGGLDLAWVNDFAALVLNFPQRGGEYRQLAWFWLPEETARERSHLAPYLDWAEREFIRLVPGKTVDMEAVVTDIAEICESFKMKAFAYDPLKAESVRQEIENETGATGYAFSQKLINYATPTAAFERLVIAKKIRHNGHPVLTWQAGHVQVYRDPNGGMRPTRKDKDDHKTIDGIVSGIMALAMAQDHEPKAVAPCAYDTHGVIAF